MGAAAVLLTLEQGSAEGSYSFVCPACDVTVEKRADRKVVMLLLSAGVEVHETGQLLLSPEAADIEDGESRLQAPPRPAPSRWDSPPFTVDDLIDFHFLLREEDWFRELISAGE